MISSRENDGEDWILVEHPGRLLYDGGGLLQVGLIQDEEVIFVECGEGGWCWWSRLVKSHGWNAQWMPGVAKQNIIKPKMFKRSIQHERFERILG